MRTMLDPAERSALIARITTLTGAEKPLWGKMSVSQMVEHCIRWEEMMAGDRKVKHIWLGYLVGKIALKSLIKDDKPVKQSMPTFKELMIIEQEPENFEQQKAKWIGLLEGYQHPRSEKYFHPFFGKMSSDQTSRLAFKHNDHHLRQFGR